jgi:hypothetical protein
MNYLLKNVKNIIKFKLNINVREFRIDEQSLFAICEKNITLIKLIHLILKISYK